MNKFQLVARAGLTRGAVWQVTDSPLIIGRDNSCDVPVADPLVSRRHCQLLVIEGRLYLRDLDSANATLVNGRPVRETVLVAGDELSFGNVTLLVTLDENSTSKVPDDIARMSTIKIADFEAIYLSNYDDSKHRATEPLSVSEMAFLMRVHSIASRCETAHDLSAQLLNILKEHFNPDAIWFLRFYGQPPREMYSTMANDTNRVPPNEVRNAVSLALRERQGLLIPRCLEGGESSVFETTLVVPIGWHDHETGAIVLTACQPKTTYEEHDLDLLLKISVTIAPYFHAMERREDLQTENSLLREATSRTSILIGNTPEIHRTRLTVARVAQTNQPVLIIGETGVGKELLATLVHELSDRAAKPLIVVNCAAIPDELFESELFGHEKGAFTGASTAKAGLLEQSDGGTLFLDEIGDLAPAHQARILRAIEVRRFRRVGGSRDIQCDFRVVAATNKDLSRAVAAKEFRQDLYHRLRGFELTLPPLRDRRADIPLLAHHFLEEARASTRRNLAGFTKEALDYLSGCAWPGNVRELRNTIFAAVALCPSSLLDTHDLQEVKGIDSIDTRPEPLDEIEKRHMIRALEYCHGNVVQAALVLGIGKSSLYEKLQRYGLR